MTAQSSQGITMQTSARNQFAGEVVAAHAGAVNDEIVIGLPTGQQIVATVTSESARRLGLTQGRKAVAMVKATSVIVMVDGDPAMLSTRNAIAGTVTEVRTGAVNTDVTITTAGGVAIAAVITNSSAARLGLAAGKPATAIFKAASVIVGVDG